LEARNREASGQSCDRDFRRLAVRLTGPFGQLLITQWQSPSGAFTTLVGPP
jgi:hypothetical protein